MKLSVIVPVYNVEKYISRCIDSILGQSFSDLELILVDDGSTDRSLTICQDYAKQDPRIIVLHKKNSGQADARNMGLDVAQGEFVTFIDSDDYVDTDMFRYMLSASLEYDADIVTCELECIDESGSRINETIPEHDDIPVPESELLYNFYHTEDRKGHTSGVVCGKIFKRTLFSSLRFPSGRIYEDTYVIPYLYEKTKMLVITSKPFYKYWIRQGSTVNSRFYEKNLDVLYVMADQYRFFAERPHYGQTDRALFTYVRYFISNYYVVHLCHPEHKRALSTYKKKFIKMLPSILKAPIICRMEKLCILSMLVFPKLAIHMTRKYFPESLPTHLRAQDDG